jgi:D-sedoheptulose 7-phosphate isomerase
VKQRKIDFLLSKEIANNVETTLNLSSQCKEIFNAINIFHNVLEKGKKIFIFGNGGSCSQAEHFSTEFLVRLNKDIKRKPYPIIPLTFNSSYLTAYSNDFLFNDVFLNSIKALVQKGDCIWVFSTSGKSKNIIKALEYSKKNNIKSIGFFGEKQNKLCNINICVKSSKTANIQEAHLFLGHFILNQVEKLLVN